ncbi:MAG: H-type lectin domain-containing protein [Cyanobacteria bacterium P01_G01_bin.67]
MIDINSLPIPALVGVITGLIGSFIAFKIEAGVNKERINELKVQVGELKEDIKQGLGKTLEERIIIVNDKLIEQSNAIEIVKTTVSQYNSHINFIKNDIAHATQNYKELISILDKFDDLKDKQDDFKNFEEIFELLSKYKKIDINIYKRFESLEQKIKENHFGNYQDLIKLDRCSLYESDFEKVEGGNDNQREAKKRIDFDHKYNYLPKVFVAIANIDAATELYSRETGTIINPVAYAKSLQSRYVRLKVDTNHIDNQGFTVVALTWNDSIVFCVDIVWIVFGS